MRLKNFDNLILILLLVIPLTSCQALLIEPEESAARTAAKIAARVPMAIATLGSTKFQYLCARSGDITGTPEERLAACAPDPCTDCYVHWNNSMWDWQNHQIHHARGHHHHDC
jgi:hypothetical protein